MGPTRPSFFSKAWKRKTHFLQALEKFGMVFSKAWKNGPGIFQTLEMYMKNPALDA
jgi:hypothetical protein